MTAGLRRGNRWSMDRPVSLLRSELLIALMLDCRRSRRKKDEAERERERVKRERGEGKEREVHMLQECVSREQAIFD